MQHFRSNPPSRSIRPRPPMPTTGRQLHAMIVRHLALTGMSESRFGRAAVGDPAFVSRLRAGTTPQDITLRRAFNFVVEASHA